MSITELLALLDGEIRGCGDSMRLRRLADALQYLATKARQQAYDLSMDERTKTGR